MAKFTLSNDIYTYQPGTIAEYFKANESTHPENNSNYYSNSYTYVPQAKMDNLNLILLGLGTTLGNELTIGIDGTIKSGVLPVGIIDYDAKKVTLYVTALPQSPTANTLIQISGDGYTLALSGVTISTEYNSASILFTNRNLTYYSCGRKQGYYDARVVNGITIPNTTFAYGTEKRKGFTLNNQTLYVTYSTSYRTENKQTIATITADVTLVDNNSDADYVLAFADTDSRFGLNAANNTITYTPT